MKAWKGICLPVSHKHLSSHFFDYTALTKYGFSPLLAQQTSHNILSLSLLCSLITLKVTSWCQMPITTNLSQNHE